MPARDGVGVGCGWDSLPRAEVVPEASVLMAWRSILHLLPTLRGME